MITANHSRVWQSSLALAFALFGFPCTPGQTVEEVLQGATPVPTPAAETGLANPPPDPLMPETLRNVRGRGRGNVLAWEQRSNRDQVIFGRDLELGPNEDVNDVVVILGNAKIRGHVESDLVVIFGDLDLDSVVNHDVVVILGKATLGPQAKVLGDLVVIGGGLAANPAALIQRNVRNVSFGSLFSRLAWSREWLTKGLFWARPLPHQVTAAWVVAGLFLAMYLLLAALFPKPVAASAQVLDDRPATAFLTGVLGSLLMAPLLLLLAVSVFGLIVIPFLMCASVGALLIGKTAVFSYLGGQISRSPSGLARGSLLLKVLLGGALVCLLYTIPLLGILVWFALAPLALGSVLLAAIQNLRRDAPVTEPVRLMPNPTRGTPPMAAPIPTADAPSHPVPPTIAPPEGVMCQRAGFWRRTVATFLDTIPFVLVAGLAAPIFPVFLLFVLLLLMTYHVAMWSWKGTTMGGAILGLKLVRTDGRPVNFGVAFVRSLASFFSGLVFFMGFFWVGWDRNKQSWHDKIAGTVIVRMPAGVPLILA